MGLSAEDMEELRKLGEYSCIQHLVAAVKQKAKNSLRCMLAIDMTTPDGVAKANRQQSAAMMCASLSDNLEEIFDDGKQRRTEHVGNGGDHGAGGPGSPGESWSF